jgi:SAM-dependent methyltransferase
MAINIGTPAVRAKNQRLYDRIGYDYTRERRADPRIAARVMAALGGARTVVNVGAGAGAYEPHDRWVLAVEPSGAMRAQRPAAAAPCLAAGAEALPLDDASVDVAMAVHTDFHWRDRRAGIAEMVRVSRHGIVVLTVDRAVAERFWLVRDYLPGVADLFAPLQRVTELLPRDGSEQVETVVIPHDCRDGFVHAHWRRPQLLLDSSVRASMAVFARLDPTEVERRLGRLAGDVESGEWRRRHSELLERSELDLGHRLVVWRRG